MAGLISWDLIGRAAITYGKDFTLVELSNFLLDEFPESKKILESLVKKVGREQAYRRISHGSVYPWILSRQGKREVVSVSTVKRNQVYHYEPDKKLVALLQEARLLSKLPPQQTEQAEGKAGKLIVKVVVLGEGFEINTDHTNQVRIHRVKTQRQDLGV